MTLQPMEFTRHESKWLTLVFEIGALNNLNRPETFHSDHSTSSSVDFAAPAQHGPRHHFRIQPSNNLRTAVSSSPEIDVRLKTNGARKASFPYSKWVLRPGILTTRFFAWLASQTGRGEGPRH